jgi:hypothetical protein
LSGEIVYLAGFSLLESSDEGTLIKKIPGNKSDHVLKMSNALKVDRAAPSNQPIHAIVLL